VVDVDAKAEARMTAVASTMTGADAERELWEAIRAVEPSLPGGPPDEWRGAVSRLCEQPRPGAWGGARGEATSMYADDTHSGGWAISCILKSLRRVAAAREHAGLSANQRKCKVLTAERWRADVDAVLQPLRGTNADAWQVVTKLRMLGVALVDPSDRAAVQAAVAETLRGRVVEPIRRLIADVEGGAQPATAYWLLSRFVLPNLMYHAQAWGLLCEDGVWAETDAALDAFCLAVCPADLRRENGELRRELS
jgi:hypothetical protein